MGDRLKGKVAIVTGSGRGLGKAEAMALAAEGAKVVINDPGVSPDGKATAERPADETVAEIKKAGGQAVANYDAVGTWKAGESLVKTAIDSFGRLDILVNNAGILRDKPIVKMVEEEWDAVLKTHLYGHFYCIRAACLLFKEQKWGRIINTSSEAGAMGNPTQSNYASAKEGIVGLTRTVAMEMGRYGVTCNVIRPRAGTRMTVTDEMVKLVDQLKAAPDPVSKARAAGMEQLMKLSPEDVAPLVVYLATNEAANINGNTFVVYGNQIILEKLMQVKTLCRDTQWTVDSLSKTFPFTLGEGMVNPAPAKP
ncbi:MAG: SDR family NAD(P)-dependent oxidoreductase [Dehalococcoidia bacterium]|nr:SDR family NAD(P)-dependent oxidoreductase [Dehalococcoidia bacterium]